MTNKKGMELSITFLVGLIIGVVLLSLGLVFTYKLFAGVSDVERMGLPNYFEIEAENCVQTVDRVCVTETKKQTETSKTASFGVIVNNIYGETKDFKLTVKFRRGETEDGQMITSIDTEEWTFSDYDTVELENNDDITIEVPIRPPKKSDAGTYVFNVNVCFDGDEDSSDKCSGSTKSLYSPTQQISVTVV